MLCYGIVFARLLYITGSKNLLKSRVEEPTKFYFGLLVILFSLVLLPTFNLYCYLLMLIFITIYLYLAPNDVKKWKCKLILWLVWSHPPLYQAQTSNDQKKPKKKKQRTINHWTALLVLFWSCSWNGANLKRILFSLGSWSFDCFPRKTYFPSQVSTSLALFHFTFGNQNFTKTKIFNSRVILSRETSDHNSKNQETVPNCLLNEEAIYNFREPCAKCSREIEYPECLNPPKCFHRSLATRAKT